MLTKQARKRDWPLIVFSAACFIGVNIVKAALNKCNFTYCLLAEGFDEAINEILGNSVRFDTLGLLRGGERKGIQIRFSRDLLQVSKE